MTPTYIPTCRCGAPFDTHLSYDEVVIRCGRCMEPYEPANPKFPDPPGPVAPGTDPVADEWGACSGAELDRYDVD